MSVDSSKQILFITEATASFTIKNIIKGLEEDGFRVENVSIADMSKALSKELPDITILQAEAFIDKPATIRNKLYNVLEEQGKHLILLGYSSELDLLKPSVPKDNLLGALVRPFENSEIHDKMEVLVATMKKKVMKKKRADGSRKNILVVDDSGVMLRTIMSWLEPKFEVALANCAAAALTSIKRSKPDLILLDYEMPMYSGAQLFEMIRNDEDGKDIPIIFLTSKGDANTVQEVLALKPQGYMLKTTPPEQIIQRIDEFFAN